jgi:protein-S-isoprenylcysteine O-methyltransferase Ste14
MFSYAALTGYCWIIFLVVWFVSAFTAKKSVRNTRLQRSLAIRYVIVAFFIFIYFRFYAGEHVLNGVGHYGSTTSNTTILTLGLIICAAGIALAIWARVYLGRNWGMPMTQREHPELVTTGPYAYIRHPIYAGVILAAIGSTITIDVLWFIPLLIYCVYFFYSAPIEEKHMAERFPDTYPAYKNRTKMLIPFVL